CAPPGSPIRTASCSSCSRSATPGSRTSRSTELTRDAVTARRYDHHMTRSRVVVVAILAAASLGGWRLGQAHRTAPAEWTVVDGDTIDVARGDVTDTVRLLGIDTPETHHPRKPVECFGPEASAYTDSKLRGRAVQLEGDVEGRDRYGRRLAYVIVDGERFND